MVGQPYQASPAKWPEELSSSKYMTKSKSGLSAVHRASNQLHRACCSLRMVAWMGPIMKWLVTMVLGVWAQLLPCLYLKHISVACPAIPGNRIQIWTNHHPEWLELAEPLACQHGYNWWSFGRWFWPIPGSVKCGFWPNPPADPPLKLTKPTAGFGCCSTGDPNMVGVTESSARSVHYFLCRNSKK